MLERCSPKSPGRIRGCLAALANGVNNFLLLVMTQLGWPAHLDAAIPCGNPAGPGTFTDRRALEFGRASQHLHHHAAPCRRSVYRLRETSKAGRAAHSPSLPRAGFAHGAINRLIT